METALAIPGIAQETEPVLYAFNAEDMRTAQVKLLQWLDRKIVTERAQAKEFAENLEIARRSKWRVSLLERQLEKAKNRIKFFLKFRAAVQAGYQPIPDLFMHNFAVRTKRLKPIAQTREDKWFPSIPNEPAQHLPAGEGENRNPSQLVKKGEYKNEKGEIIRWVQTTKYQDWLDFPFALAGTALLTETQRALQLKVFDEVGSITPRSKGDPIIAGRISGGGLTAMFLIAWFLDLKEYR